VNKYILQKGSEKVIPMIMSKINTDRVEVKFHADLRVVHKERGSCT